MTATLAQRETPAPDYVLPVSSGPLAVTVVTMPAVYARGAVLAAAGYVWQVLADDDADGSPRVRVTCRGRRTSVVFDRWQYPRADVFVAVGVAAVRALTGATFATLAHQPAGPDAAQYVGRVPLADVDRHTVGTVARFYRVADIG